MTDDRFPRSRREVLGLAAAVVAGCSGAPDGGSGSTSRTGSATTRPPSTPGTTATDAARTTTRTPAAVPGDPGSWPMFGYDLANTGYNPDATGPGGPVKRVWERDVAGVYTMAQPTVAGDGLFVASGEQAYGMDVRAGALAWTADLPHPAHHYPVAFADGRLYVASRTLVGARTGGGEGVLAAVEADGGTVLWRRRTPITAAPIPAAGGVYAASSTGTVGRVRRIAADGTERWATTFEPEGKRVTVRGAPAVEGERLYVTGADAGARRPGLVAALDRGTGDVRWRRSLSGPISAAPVLSGDTLYVATETGRVVALDRESGDHRWTLDTGGRVFTTPATDGDRLYCLLEGTLVAIAGPDEELWRTDVGSILINGLAATDDAVYVGGKSVTAVATDSGTVRWDFPIPSDAGGGYGSPIVLGESVFVGACVKESAKSMYDDAVYALA